MTRPAQRSNPAMHRTPRSRQVLRSGGTAGFSTSFTQRQGALDMACLKHHQRSVHQRGNAVAVRQHDGEHRQRATVTNTPAAGHRRLLRHQGRCFRVLREAADGSTRFLIFGNSGDFVAILTGNVSGAARRAASSSSTSSAAALPTQLIKTITAPTSVQLPDIDPARATAASSCCARRR